jgi:hypothetical protein
MAIELNGEILFSDETNGVYVVSTPEILIQTITSTKNVFYITTPLEGLITVNGEPPQGDGGATQVRNKLQSLVDDERLDASAIKNLPQGFSGAYADLTGKPNLFDGTWVSLTGKPNLSTVATSGSYNDLTNRPTIPSAPVNSDWNAVSGLAQILNKPTLFSGSYLDLTNRPTLFDGTWTSLTGKPSFSTVATSGSYLDLFNRPTIPSAQVNSDWSAVSGVAQILNKPTLFSGAYADLTGKPSLFDGTWVSLTGKPSFATVATSGNYSDLNGRPPEWTPVNRTSSYTAANGESVFCNTTSGSFSVTAPSGGGRFTVIDAVGTTPFTGFFINNLTVLPNVGQTIMGTTSLILNIGASSITFGLNGTDWRIIGN